MDKKDYYEILGVDKNATKDEIKKAYRKLAAKYHPDKYENATEEEKAEANERIKEINEANSVLSDDEKRQRYDQFGSAEPNGGFNPFDNDFDPFEGFRNGGPFGFGRSRTVVNRGTDVVVTVEITISDVLNGCDKTFSYSRKKRCTHCGGSGSVDGKVETCHTCGGSGFVEEHGMTPFGIPGTIRTTCPNCGGKGTIIKNKCPHCNGTGLESEYVSRKIRIPYGIRNGMKMPIVGEGNQSQDPNGENGNLFVVVVIKDDPLYNIDGINIVQNIWLNLDEAWLGTSKTIQCVDGSTVRISIPELSKDKSILRIKGKGLPEFQGTDVGDMFIIVNYKVPEKLTEKQKKLIKQFYSENNE